MTTKEIAKEIAVKTFLDTEGTAKDYDLWIERKIVPDTYKDISPYLYKNVDSSLRDLYETAINVLSNLELKTKD